MAKRIYYQTAFDTTNRICGYVVAEDKGKYYTISHRAYKNAMKKRTIVSSDRLLFLTDDFKPVLVHGKDIW